MVNLGVSIAGSTRIGAKCRVGMKATVLARLYISDWTVTGAGSLVNSDMPQGIVAYGTPARIIWKNEEVDFARYKANRSID